MNLQELPGSYSILKLNSREAVPAWATEGPFYSIGKTKDELSIVCETFRVPETVQNKSDDWKCLKVEGLLDFAQTGILSSIAGPLARAKISIFAVSTFNTDYILVKNDSLAKAKEALKKSGVNCSPENLPG
ncbi:MAG: ACT domain-containing protein [Bdellovibrionales bacterium]